MFLFGRAWLSLRVWNAVVSRNTENFHFESRMGHGPSLTKHLNPWSSTLDNSQEHWELFDFHIGWSNLYASYFWGIHVFPYFLKSIISRFDRKNCESFKGWQSGAPFRFPQKLKIQLQNNRCTFQLELMCTWSSLLLLLKGMAHFLPSPERPYCYSPTPI